MCGMTGNSCSGNTACSIPTKNALKEIRRGRRHGGAEERLEGNKTKRSLQMKTENLICDLD